MITKDSLNEQEGLQTMCRIVDEIVEKKLLKPNMKIL